MNKERAKSGMGSAALGLAVVMACGVPMERLACAAEVFRAGCYQMEITPQELPAIMNGGFLEKTSDQVADPLFARCLVFATHDETIALAIVDSCMIPRELCDQAKVLAESQTGIPASRILIAATHTHSAPSVMDFCLGSGKDHAYSQFLVPRIAEGIRLAHRQLSPAQAGWAVVSAPDHTHCRRWLRRSGWAPDPFGRRTVRAMMHPGYQNPEYLCPSGPVDNDLTLLSVQTVDGRPLCLLANYSMHYFGGVRGFSADYFGDFARYVEAKVAAGRSERTGSFMAAMSQGTSGDAHWMDYSRPQRAGYTRQQYAAELGEMAIDALAAMEYRTDIDVAMAETRLTLQRRMPSPARLAWAKPINRARGNRRPQSRPEVYAEQAEWIAENRSAELVLQAVRIGGLAIASMPNEVFGITGLKLKAQSPIQPLMNLELANGAEGYIPPPEQHFLGGYTTWPARTAGLETTAEPQIVEALLGLLERILDGSTRRPPPRQLYTPRQEAAIDRARADDNNRENR